MEVEAVLNLCKEMANIGASKDELSGWKILAQSLPSIAVFTSAILGGFVTWVISNSKTNQEKHKLFYENELRILEDISMRWSVYSKQGVITANAIKDEYTDKKFPEDYVHEQRSKLSKMNDIYNEMKSKLALLGMIEALSILSDFTSTINDMDPKSIRFPSKDTINNLDKIDREKMLEYIINESDYFLKELEDKYKNIKTA